MVVYTLWKLAGQLDSHTLVIMVFQRPDLILLLASIGMFTDQKFNCEYSLLWLLRESLR